MSDQLRHSYNYRYGPLWYSQYYHDQFGVDKEGQDLPPEAARARFEAEWEKEEVRVAQLKWLEEREVARVQQESRNTILGKVSARYAEVADPETLESAARATTAETLRHGWSGTRNERVTQDQERW